jgi:hypothetical protein
VQISAELDQDLKMTGISLATRTRNIQPVHEQTVQQLLAFGKQLEETKPFTSATPRGLA